ncbi:alpha-glucosidase/alpha-galactosidase [Candidatus Bathyarchaeota archaeon]|nr:alpha-glucosidase/alpha-galactosidase [Candidatus Bathyarchaeota archaeon]
MQELLELNLACLITKHGLMRGELMKITFIGAGSIVFAKKVIKDLLTFPKMREDTLIILEDIDKHRLDLMHAYFQKYKEDNPRLLEGVTFEATTDQKKAIDEAKYVISAIQVGSLDAYKLDLEIPLKHGITQTVGDTLGPGGVFRGLRTMNAFESILEDIKDVGFQGGKQGNERGFAQKPLFLNYTNPMAINTWYCNLIMPGSTVGLCHGVQGTANLLRMYVGAAPGEFYYLAAGINHMAWFLEIWFKDSFTPGSDWINAYPILWEHFEEEPEIMGSEKVRWDMMKATGFFMTESSGHLSEYLPYYRKRKDLLEKFKGADTGFDSLEHAEYYKSNIRKASTLEEEFTEELNKDHLSFETNSSSEYCAHVINAIETNSPFRFNGNIMNHNASFITNLPRGCCVEVPIFVDTGGLHPEGGISLPIQCQALCMSNIMVQKATVEGFLERDKEKIYHAVMLDPNTASICSPGEIREMVSEMFESQERWLPGF